MEISIRLGDPECMEPVGAITDYEHTGPQVFALVINEDWWAAANLEQRLKLVQHEVAHAVTKNFHTGERP